MVSGSRASSKRLYRESNLIERPSSKLKHFRRVVTRDDKLVVNFLAMVHGRCNAAVAAGS